MPGAPKVKVARSGFNVITTNNKDLSFSSDFNLNKIARAKKFTNTNAAAHGLSYTPKFMCLREISTGKFGGGGVCTVDGTNITPTISTHINTYGYGSTTSTDDTATWVYIFIDPLVEGVYRKDMKRIPGIIAGEGLLESDHQQTIHSGYDTFKVHSTGTLTIEAPEYDPGSGGGVKTTTATVNHGLGYVPIFAPFVPYETERASYLSWNSQYQNDIWTVGTTFYTGQEVLNDTTSVWYVCKLTHTSSNDNKPATGANWTTYWDVYTEPDFYTTYVNALEDQKYVYGGVEEFNLSYIKYYATATQLVLELTQDCAPDAPPFYEQTPCPAETVYVDYTIFYNQANAEFNLL